MTRKRSVVVAATLAAALVVGLQPAAGAAPIGAGKLCVRHPAAAFEGRSARRPAHPLDPEPPDRRRSRRGPGASCHRAGLVPRDP